MRQSPPSALSNTRRLAGLAGALALTLACQTLSLGPATPTDLGQAATPQILADCFWSAEALAWVDTNANGTPDEGEPPLAGVAVTFSLTFLGGATTGADGRAQWSGMYPSACDPALANSVVAETPEGYTPTTDLVVALTEGRAEYAFGFTSSP